MIQQSELEAIIDAYNHMDLLIGRVARRLLDGERVEPGPYRVEMTPNDSYDHFDGRKNYVEICGFLVTGNPPDECTVQRRILPGFIVEPQ